MRSTLFCAVLAVLLPVILLAQPNGSINGAVLDTSGAVIPNANLSLVNIGSGQTWRAASSEQGYFVFPDLPPGSYTLRVTAGGFREFVQGPLVLTVGQQLSVRPTMQVGNLSEVVEVTGTPPPVATTSSSVSHLVDSQRIAQLPLNGRNALQLVALVPGVVGAGQGGQFGVSQVQFRVSGGRPADMNYSLDGGFNMNSFYDLANDYPNPDALQEFAVSTRTYTATVGRGMAFVSAVTKSGTNEFHGTLFEFLRNTNLDARPFFAPSRSDFKRNQYGGTFGGPILKNRLLFFFSYQGTKERGSPGARRYRTANAAERIGDFSGAAAVKDPTTGQPFPGNLVPASSIRSYATQFLKEYVPPANSGPNFYSFALANKLDQNQAVGKVDYLVTDQDRVSFRYFLNDLPQRGVGGNVIIDNRWITDLPTRTQNWNLSYTRTFSPSLVNEIRLTYLRSVFGAISSLQFSLDKLGLGVNVSNSISAFGLSPDSKINVAGYFNGTPPAPTRDIMPTTHLNDTASWISGKHKVDFGVEVYRNRVNELQNWLTAGNLNINGSASGNAMADFLLGRYNSYRQITPTISRLRQWLPALFAQDDYRVHRNLTLNLGLRWEPFFGFVSENDMLATFSPPTQSTTFPLMPPGLLYPGDAGLLRSVVGNRWNNFGPRLGLAWDVRGNGHTSVRAGFGIYYVPLTRGISMNRFPLIQPYTLDVTTLGGDTNNFFAAAPFNGVNPFPRPDVSDQQALRRLPFAKGASFTSLALPFKTPSERQWSLSLQQSAGKDSVVEINYVGSSSAHMFTSAERNFAVYTPGASTLGNTQQRRLYPDIGPINEVKDALSSNYNSLQVTFKKRYSAGWSILSSYTYGKALGVVAGEGEGSNGPRDPNNYQGSYGPLAGDLRHNFVTSVIWDLPLARDRAPAWERQLLGGWQIGSIVTIQSGSPFTIASGRDNSLVGVANDNADQIKDWRLPGGRSRGEKIAAWFDPTAFVQNPTGTFGNVGMNSMRGPGSWDVDTAISKQFRLTETKSLDFRASFYNIFNNVRLGNPNATQNSPTFGQINSAGDPRIIEFGLKMTF